eukprot:TRINITY_DN67335_c7_g4_i2.p1 TRINITY_DN67335_c7_g4~~TRINITY_DN67335_c7_g4_i2.p1  ORF type:complete len:627 (+),score=250.54 TRINITY_DN67335_c7_g4_i2:149-1882(+)
MSVGELIANLLIMANAVDDTVAVCHIVSTTSLSMDVFMWIVLLLHLRVFTLRGDTPPLSSLATNSNNSSATSAGGSDHLTESQQFQRDRDRHEQNQAHPARHESAMVARIVSDARRHLADPGDASARLSTSEAMVGMSALLSCLCIVNMLMAGFARADSDLAFCLSPRSLQGVSLMLHVLLIVALAAVMWQRASQLSANGALLLAMVVVSSALSIVQVMLDFAGVLDSLTVNFIRLISAASTMLVCFAVAATEACAWRGARRHLYLVRPAKPEPRASRPSEQPSRQVSQAGSDRVGMSSTRRRSSTDARKVSRLTQSVPTRSRHLSWSRVHQGGARVLQYYPPSPQQDQEQQGQQQLQQERQQQHVSPSTVDSAGAPLSPQQQQQQRQTMQQVSVSSLNAGRFGAISVDEDDLAPSQARLLRLQRRWERSKSRLQQQQVEELYNERRTQGDSQYRSMTPVRPHRGRSVEDSLSKRDSASRSGIGGVVERINGSVGEQPNPPHEERASRDSATSPPVLVSRSSTTGTSTADAVREAQLLEDDRDDRGSSGQGETKRVEPLAGRDATSHPHTPMRQRDD